MILTAEIIIVIALSVLVSRFSPQCDFGRMQRLLQEAAEDWDASSE